MQLLTNVILQPVVELLPSVFDENDYPFKYRATIEERYLYWKSIMQKNGLPNLEPIEKGSNFVALSDFDEASLTTFMEYVLAGVDPEEKIFIVGNGGVVMKSGEQLVVAPQCCISMEDYKEWTQLKQSTEFCHIWIGHPWMYYKTVADNIYFTGLIEKDMSSQEWKHYITTDNTHLHDFSYPTIYPNKNITDKDIKYVANWNEIQAAAHVLQARVDDFVCLLESVIEKLNMPNAKAIANQIVNGNGEFPSYNAEDLE